MKRQTEREQIHRLAVKTLDQVFMARACEGPGCSMFESQTLTELIEALCVVRLFGIQTLPDISVLLQGFEYAIEYTAFHE